MNIRLGNARDPSNFGDACATESVFGKNFLRGVQNCDYGYFARSTQRFIPPRAARCDYARTSRHYVQVFEKVKTRLLAPTGGAPLSGIQDAGRCARDLFHLRW